MHESSLTVVGPRSPQLEGQVGGTDAEGKFMTVSQAERKARRREEEHRGAKRLCAVVGCGAYLSRYNEGIFCGIHSDHALPGWMRRGQR